jgi:hypothetical protein
MYCLFQVYLIYEGARRPINSVEVMLKYGYDFDQVRVSTSPGELQLLPLGPPL